MVSCPGWDPPESIEKLVSSEFYASLRTMADSVQSGQRQREEGTDKWSKILQNSKQITEEPLKRYRLITIKEDLKEDGLVRRYTFGKKDPTKRNRTILMVGETGTGKSTLINMMLNYMLGVKWEDDVRFEIVPDEGERPQTESQTAAVTAYEIYGLEEFSVPFSLTVIDTPGYGDTRGDEQDKCIPQNLYNLFHSVRGVQQLDAACIVVKATVNRLSEKEKYIFDGVLSLFGKNMEKNIMILATHSNWGPPQALEAIIESGVPHAKDENNEPVHFLFDNPPFKKPAKKYESACKTGWEKGAESMHDFFQALDQMEAQSLKMTENVLKQRLRLEDSLPGLMEQLEHADFIQKAVEKTKKTLEQHKEDMEKNKNFSIPQEVAIITEETADEPVTRCTVCKVNCHPKGCWWVSDLSWCTVMKNEYCTVCPKKCHYTKHEKGHIKYVHKLEKRTETYEDLKAKEKVQTAEMVMARQQRELEKAEGTMKTLQDKAFKCVFQLKEYALKFNTNSIMQYIVPLIEMFKKNNDTDRAETLEKMVDRDEEKTEPPHEDV